MTSRWDDIPLPAASTYSPAKKEEWWNLTEKESDETQRGVTVFQR